MPALLISTSSPPRRPTASGTMRSMSARRDMSQGRAINPGISLAIASSALASMSQTNTLAPVAANARANSRPMPAAPAVIKTRCGIVAPSPVASSSLGLHESKRNPSVASVRRQSLRQTRDGAIALMLAHCARFGYNVRMKIRACCSKALERIENWPADAQDQLAEIAFDHRCQPPQDVVYEPTDEESAGIERGLRDAAEGRFATDAEVAAAFAKFRRR